MEETLGSSESKCVMMLWAFIICTIKLIGQRTHNVHHVMMMMTATMVIIIMIILMLTSFLCIVIHT